MRTMTAEDLREIANDQEINTITLRTQLTTLLSSISLRGDPQRKPLCSPCCSLSAPKQPEIVCTPPTMLVHFSKHGTNMNHDPETPMEKLTRPLQAATILVIGPRKIHIRKTQRVFRPRGDHPVTRSPEESAKWDWCENGRAPMPGLGRLC
jgi:hypothetical protein